jgi:hypothetical protein
MSERLRVLIVEDNPADADLMHDALPESDDRFKKLFVEAPLGIALIDSLMGHIYEVNPMFAKIVARTMEDAVDAAFRT